LWKKVINFNSEPVRGFAMPFAFADSIDFRKQATKVNGLFLDRNRIVGTFSRIPVGVIFPGLSKKLIDWLVVEVALLPKDAS